MTTYSTCKNIRRLLLSKQSEVFQFHDTWHNEFCVNEIMRIHKVILAAKDFKPVDITDLTSEQLDDLGFSLWDEKLPIKLIPAWLLPFLTNKITCTGLDGITKVRNRDSLDKDNRFSCLSYGVLTSIEKKNNTTSQNNGLPPLPEPFEMLWPSMHSEGLGCGVEDRGISNRYEAAQYGWQVGFDAAIESVPELFSAEQMHDYALASQVADHRESLE